jgi:hypothetical protein
MEYRVVGIGTGAGPKKDCRVRAKETDFAADLIYCIFLFVSSLVGC